MSTTAEQFHNLVHAAVDGLTAARHDGATPVPVAADAVLAECGPLAAAWSVERWRWHGHEAARQVASYLAFLQPPAGWVRLDAAVLGADPALLWQHPDGTTLAEVLSTRNRGAAVWHRHATGRPRRLVRAGQDRFGDAFVGVRVLALTAPAASLLVTGATGAPQPLVETPWWLRPAPADAVALVMAAAGEVAR